jgi:hypothetical protein
MSETEAKTENGAKSTGGIAPALMITFAALGSLLPSWAGLPIPLYDPMGRGWRVAVLGTPGGPRIEMGYYGIYLAALVGALLGALLGRALERMKVARTINQALLDAWAFTALALAAAYQAWALWP